MVTHVGTCGALGADTFDNVIVGLQARARVLVYACGISLVGGNEHALAVSKHAHISVACLALALKMCPHY